MNWGDGFGEFGLVGSLALTEVVADGRVDFALFGGAVPADSHFGLRQEGGTSDEAAAAHAL